REHLARRDPLVQVREDVAAGLGTEEREVLEVLLAEFAAHDETRGNLGEAHRPAVDGQVHDVPEAESLHRLVEVQLLPENLRTLTAEGQQGERVTRPNVGGEENLPECRRGGDGG